MNVEDNTKVLSEEEIDEIVIAQADDDSAWEEPMRVQRERSAFVKLPAEMATRAAFFARLHREASVEDWLKRIIQERLDLEEAALTGLKRELGSGSSG